MGEPEPDVQAGDRRWLPLVAEAERQRGTNPFYESMREVSPGDIVFSFADTGIAATGIARSYCWGSPKPQEFGAAGQNWENVGWKVRVHFVPLLNKVRPKDHMNVLRAVLPDKYSPLQPNGNGIQSVYLTEVALCIRRSSRGPDRRRGDAGPSSGNRTHPSAQRASIRR